MLTDAGNELSVFERAKTEELEHITEWTLAMADNQFISHRSAAILWGAPVPHRPGAPVHASVLKPLRAPRAEGVIGHKLDPAHHQVATAQDTKISTPWSTWVQLGDQTVQQLVILGDYLVRKYRPGFGRRDVGRAPLATLAELANALSLGRRPGAQKLRIALPLIREDSWSPQETVLRLTITHAGLPEPQLNVDVFDSLGQFLACVDLAYVEYKVGIEYHGEQYHQHLAADVERNARLRDDLWVMIEVTDSLRRTPWVVIRRVEQALRQRGWPGPPRHTTFRGQ